MAKQPFRGSELGGLGGAGDLGEHRGNPERYAVEPVSGDVQQHEYPGKGLGPGTASKRKIIEDERLDLEQIRTLVAADDSAIVTARLLGVAPLRIDSGIKNRTSILIANMSDVVVWVGTNGQGLGANSGYPLAANAPAGSYNGGTISMDVSERTQFWAVAAGGAANLVVVIESAR